MLNWKVIVSISPMFYDRLSYWSLLWLSSFKFNVAHVKHYVLLFMIWDFDLEFSIFLTFSFFWAFLLASVKKVVSFTFLRYFNLKIEYRGVLSIFLFLLVWSWSIPYLTILALHPPFSKFSEPPLALFLKRNHPEKYQVSKRFFFIRNKFL